MISIPRRRRHSPAATGRSALVSGAAASLALYLGLTVGLDRWLPEIRNPIHAAKTRVLDRRLAAAVDRPPVVVMFGSSRARDALDGRRAEDVLAGPCGRRPVVFNFGISGAGPVAELLTLRRLLHDGLRPDVVLVEVLPAALAEATNYWNRDLTPELLASHELAWVTPYAAAPGAMRSRWLGGTLVSGYTNRRELVACYAPLFVPGRMPCLGLDAAMDECGSLRRDPGEQISPEVCQQCLRIAREQYRDVLRGFRLGGSAPRALRDFLELCRREDITRRLVIMPEGAEFRAMYPPEVWRQIEDFLAQLSRDCDAPLIDARLWLADEQFLDSHHPLPCGAVIFSERLAREHLLPLLTGTQPGRP